LKEEPSDPLIKFPPVYLHVPRSGETGSSSLLHAAKLSKAATANKKFFIMLNLKFCGKDKAYSL
jgi:hypothetical protein